MKGKLLKAAGALLVVIPMFAFSIPTASAAVIVCTPNSGTRYRITSYTKAGRLNGGEKYYSLAAGAYAEETVTTTTTYAAGIAISTGSSISADAILAKAEVSVGVTLHENLEKTISRTVRLGVTNNTSSMHRYVFWDGEMIAYGNWVKEKCNSSGTGYVSTPIGSGTWKSWHLQIKGVTRCDQDATVASTYGTASPEYKAATTCT